MKRFIRNITLIFIPFWLGIISLFILPLNKKFAYYFVKGECNNKAAWIYNRTFENPKNIDIAFSGASQTGCAIMDSYIEENLQQQTGKEIRVANLGYCRRGRDIQYTMLKDLLEHKNPGILVIEVPEDEPKKSHPVFPYLANSEDLFGSAVLFNQRYLSAILKGLTIRFEQLKWWLFSETKHNYGYSDYGYITSQQVVSAENIRINELAWGKRLSKDKLVFHRRIELNYSKHYIRKIAKLAQDNNCQLLFLYLPESGYKLTKPLLIDFYSEIAPVIFLKDSTIQNPTNWKDATHFNDNGAKEVSKQISETLLPYLYK